MAIVSDILMFESSSKFSQEHIRITIVLQNSYKKTNNTKT